MTISKELITELLEVQAEFDARIESKNISDTTVALVVELFEWINATELFKNWKATPGKGRDVELDELADVLAFGLSLFNQARPQLSDVDYEAALNHVIKGFDELSPVLEFESPIQQLHLAKLFLSELYSEGVPGHNMETITFGIYFPFVIAHVMYSTEELVDAYKAKMEHNHARQDGTVDEDKGYV